MHLGRRPHKWALLLVAAAAAWMMLRPEHFEVGVLRTFGDRSDMFTSLWVLDDVQNDFVWIRAHRSDRRWLHQLQAAPKVELRRDGVSRPYRAQVFDDDATRSYVSVGFREKYGWADLVRELTQGSDTVSVRLRLR